MIGELRPNHMRQGTRLLSNIGMQFAMNFWYSDEISDLYNGRLDPSLHLELRDTQAH